MAQRTCSIDGCDNSHDARGWCGTHYRRWQLYGDPLVLRVPRAKDEAERIARRRASKTKWRLANPDQMAAARATWNAENREWWRERGRRRRQEHPEEKRAGEARRRARKLRVPVVVFTPIQLEARLAVYGCRCWMCGGPGKTVDHVKPLSKGGAHILCNIRPACLSCNVKKGNQWPYDTRKSAQSSGHDPSLLNV